MLGHEVRHFESWDRSRYRDFAELNQRLLEAVEQFRPEVMLTVHMGYELWLETLEIIRARGDVATISWAADDSWKYREVSRFVGPAYHAMTTTYDHVVPQYHRDGINHVLLTQWGVSSEWLAEPLPASQCRFQVSFVGAAHGDRRKLVDRLRSAGIEVSCFGHGWPEGAVAMDMIPRIMRESVISLNFANSKGQNQIKARAFEVPGAGGLLLTEYAAGIERFYVPGKEIEVFHDYDELVEKIRHYLAHQDERDAVALAGFDRSRREHTYEQRMQCVLDYTLSAKTKAPTHPATRSFEDALTAHRLTPSLRLLRNTMTWGGRLLLGPQRGPRVARRLIFELSWRLFGYRTFTAAGWPGRMFYREG
jgi:spore maturation protein CgeB